MQIGKLAVKSGIWPLKEYVDGTVIHTKVPGIRMPVEDYLCTQLRFAHMFAPERNNRLINEIQDRIDAYWEYVT